MTFTPEQDQYLQLQQTCAYYQGLREGVQRFAWWRDGTQYVGTTGLTLKQAIAQIDQEQQDTLSKFRI